MHMIRYLYLRRFSFHDIEGWDYGKSNLSDKSVKVSGRERDPVLLFPLLIRQSVHQEKIFTKKKLIW